MVLLPWDQEKIVVVCLITFCYFLYYVSNVSITAALMEKKKIIEETLTNDIDLRISLLICLIGDTKKIRTYFTGLLGAILSSFNAALAGLLMNSQNMTQGNLFNFYALNQELFFVREQKIVIETNKVLLLTKTLLIG